MASQESERHLDRRRNPDKDERVKLPLDPETALRALLEVPAENDSEDDDDRTGEERSKP